MEYRGNLCPRREYAEAAHRSRSGRGCDGVPREAVPCCRNGRGAHPSSCRFSAHAATCGNLQQNPHARIAAYSRPFPLVCGAKRAPSALSAYATGAKGKGHKGGWHSWRCGRHSRRPPVCPSLNSSSNRRKMICGQNVVSQNSREVNFCS